MATDRRESERPDSGSRDARSQRLKAALRANLKRRKAQARGREAAPMPASRSERAES